MSAISRQHGLLCERLALAELTRMGALALQRIATPNALIRGKRVYTQKVVGDIIGVWPVTGRAILCECKARLNNGVYRRPVPSDFETHQVATLKLWHAAMGSALVAYLFGDTPIILIEPAINFFTSEKHTIHKGAP